MNAGGGIGVRISSDAIAAKLVNELGRPITATSANLAGSPPAREAARAQLPGVALVLDGGPRDAPPSTVVEVSDAVVALRQGAIRLGKA